MIRKVPSLRSSPWGRATRCRFIPASRKVASLSTGAESPSEEDIQRLKDLNVAVFISPERNSPSRSRERTVDEYDHDRFRWPNYQMRSMEALDCAPQERLGKVRGIRRNGLWTKRLRRNSREKEMFPENSHRKRAMKSPANGRKKNKIELKVVTLQLQRERKKRNPATCITLHRSMKMQLQKRAVLHHKWYCPD